MKDVYVLVCVLLPGDRQKYCANWNTCARFGFAPHRWQKLCPKIFYAIEQIIVAEKNPFHVVQAPTTLLVFHR